VRGADPAERGRQLAAAARSGDRRALARLLTEIEDRTRASEAALRGLHAHARHAHLVGLTGAPGSGKSTLVAALVAAVREDDRPVAVLAIDPSSPITGGAILGDRVRMQRHAGDDGVFIRSMASRGHAGGLAATTIAAAAALAASGFDLVLIETVGTGQGEVEVAAVADTTIVVQAPEMGDEVQAIKAGLLEVADVVVVSKADRPGASRAAAQLRAMLTVGIRHDPVGDRPRPKRPDVLLVSGTSGQGVAELLSALDRRRPGGTSGADADAGAAGVGSGAPHARARLARAEAQVAGILADRVRERLRDPSHRGRVEEILAAVAEHRIDPYTAADQIEEAARDRSGHRESV
jgi:LAO/AO transport system kinase